MLKNINGFENYKIDEYGNIYNKNNKILHPYINNKGYKCIDLIGLDKTKNKFLIHRLVALHFVPNPNNHPIVLHLDNNKLNTYYLNLKWGTYSENNSQAIKDGLNTIPKPDNRKRYQLYNDQEIIECIGISSIINLNNYGNDSMMRNYILRKSMITKGNYQGYKIRKITKPIYFDDNR